MRLMVVDGVNLGRLGSREPDVYITTTPEQLAAACRQAGTALDGPPRSSTQES